MTEGRDLGICGVVASGACVVSIPAHFGTCRYLGFMVYEIVTEGIYIGVNEGIVASGACVGCIPPLGAGRIGDRCGVIMPQGRDLGVCSVIAPGTRVVSVPTCLAARRYLVVVMYDIMTESRDL